MQVQSVCVVTLHRPPTCPLFPYTTLFRSIADREVAAQRAPRDEGVGGVVAGGSDRRPESAPPGAAHGQPAIGAVERGGQRDRKSTRLNSSHGYISYAVFCLKKITAISEHA